MHRKRPVADVRSLRDGAEMRQDGQLEVAQGLGRGYSRRGHRSGVSQSSTPQGRVSGKIAIFESLVYATDLNPFRSTKESV